MMYEKLEELAAPVKSPHVPDRHAFLIEPASFADKLTCLKAQTYCGYDQSTDRWIIVGKNCNQWSCPFCARVKIRKLAWLTERAKPNRLLTLTVAKTKYPDGRAAFDRRSRQLLIP